MPQSAINSRVKLQTPPWVVNDALTKQGRNRATGFALTRYAPVQQKSMKKENYARTAQVSFDMNSTGIFSAFRSLGREKSGYCPW